MDKKKRTITLGDDGEILGGPLPGKPKRSARFGLRQMGCVVVVAILLGITLGAVIGVIIYSRYQPIPASPLIAQLTVPTQPPTLPPTQALIQATATPVPATPGPTKISQTVAPSGISHILWVSNCDPRTDAQHCHQGKIDIFNEFYATVQSLGSDVTYRLPASSAEMDSYDVVVLSYCDFAASALPVKLFQDYVSAGGSLMVMGDNFCQGVHVDGKFGSSAQAANRLTTSWGISFTADDDSKNPEIETLSQHPLTAGIKAIYAFRHAYLGVQTPATAIATVNNQAVIAVYSGTGTVVAFPDTGFVWGSAFRSQVGSSDNFKFWQNSLVWLSQQAHAKRHL